MERNQEALALAFKSLSVSIAKIGELGIKPTATDDELGELSITLAKIKAEAEHKKDEWKTFVKGQDFYLKSLRTISGLSNKEGLEHFYRREFASVATEAEMLEALDDMRPEDLVENVA